jgi:long-subunit acyl-CoA synthetase (AMP-forming)
MNTPEIAALGTGGAALPGLEARLGEGNEIQIKGPTVMTGGYLNRDDKTKESFTDDGWYRTGDTGKIVKTRLPISMARVAGYTAAGTGLGAAVGALVGHPAIGAAVGAVASSAATVLSGIARPEGKDHYIISGRIKSQFKLPGGEYVTPEPIEAALQGSPFIARALVTGGKERDLVGALIQPNFEALTKWCADKGISGTPEELVKNPEVVKLFETEAQNASSTFNKHEVVRRVALLPKELTGDEVTNKGEVMRSIVAERYSAQITAMFA